MKNSAGQILLSFISLYIAHKKLDSPPLFFLIFKFSIMFLFSIRNDHITAILPKYLTHSQMEKRQPTILLPLAEFSRSVLLHLETWIIKWVIYWQWVMCGRLQSGRYLRVKTKIAEQKLFSIHIRLKIPQMKWTTHSLTLQAAAH